MGEPFGSPLPAQYTYPQPSQGYGQPQFMGWGGMPPSFSGPPLGGPTDYEDELPILEELGIDLGAIIRKSRATLLGRVSSDSLKDVDMGGPLLFAAGLAALHLLHGRLHFGVILGWTAAADVLFWFLVHQLAGHGVEAEKEVIDLYNCSACLGYSLLPLLVANAAAVFLPRGSRVAAALVVSAAVYCASLAGRLVTRRAPFLAEQRATITFPAFLYYYAMALVSLY